MASITFRWLMHGYNVTLKFTAARTGTKFWQWFRRRRIF